MGQTALATCRAFWNSRSEICHDLCLCLVFPSRQGSCPIMEAGGSPLPMEEELMLLEWWHWCVQVAEEGQASLLQPWWILPMVGYAQDQCPWVHCQGMRSFPWPGAQELCDHISITFVMICWGKCLQQYLCLWQTPTCGTCQSSVTSAVQGIPCASPWIWAPFGAPWVLSWVHILWT